MNNKEIESLWEECKDISCHLNKNNLLVIDVDWYIFTQGTCIDDIKQWFIDNYSQDINNLITDQYKNGGVCMNKVKRNKINEARKLLERANDIINDVMNEEDDAFNNLSEGLQQTMRGEQMEDNVNEMDEAINNINEAINNLDNIE